MIRLGVYEEGKISNLGRSKLYFRRDSSIQVLEQNQYNVYKVDIPYEYSINVIFNVFNLYLFDVCDNSRLNTFKDKGNDENQ
jgi:hypothetical protein